MREVRRFHIRDHLRPPADDPRSRQGHDFDFTDVVFDGGDFSDAHFSGGRVSFVGAVFSRWADFRFTEFSGGRVDFQYATGGAPSGLLRGGRVPAGVVLPEQWIASGALGE